MKYSEKARQYYTAPDIADFLVTVEKKAARPLKKLSSEWAKKPNAEREEVLRSILRWHIPMER